MTRILRRAHRRIALAGGILLPIAFALAMAYR